VGWISLVQGGRSGALLWKQATYFRVS
jgi:hypothetical protein